MSRKHDDKGLPRGPQAALAACLTGAIALGAGTARAETPGTDALLPAIETATRADTSPLDEEPTAEGVPAPAMESPKVEEVYVTGSRIRRKDLATSGPVSVMNRQQLDASGRRSIGETLQQLPAQSGGTSTQDNGAAGEIRVALRNLGAERTLVLVNGRRFVPGGTGADSAVDLSVIPDEIIERVEVLKDGASAVYGSDAIGGVINIITRKSFSGIEASTYTGGTAQGAFNYNLGVTAGETGARGHIFLSLQFYKQRALMAGKRSFSSTDREYHWDTGVAGTTGSGAIPQGRVLGTRENAGGNSAWQRVTGRRTESELYVNDPHDGWRVFDTGGNYDAGEGDFYNYQPENYVITPSQRLSLWTGGEYALVGSKASVYFEGSYTGRRSEQLIAPEAFFSSDQSVAVSADNVYNPFGTDFFSVDRRFVESGNRIFDQDISTYRAVVGVHGDLPAGLPSQGWKWDVSFVYGRTAGVSLSRGLLRKSRIADALGPSFIDDQGRAVCGERESPIADCTPLDMFGGSGSVTRDMLARLTYEGTDRGVTEQGVASAVVEGALFRLWNRPVGVAFGYQLRRESGSYTPDPITASGDSTGGAVGATSGGYTENAGFLELSVPVLADLPGVELLESSAAVRVFDFSSFGTNATWKLGGRWQIVDHVALRATYSQAFRAPSIAELYAGNADFSDSAYDPCSNDEGTVEGPAKENCARAGVPANFEDASSQFTTVAGGNPHLKAETARIATAGVVVTPKGSRWVENLSITADYFFIDVDSAIERKGAAYIFSSCYNRGDAEDCALITRDQFGYVKRIQDQNTNLGGLTTAGLDVGFTYAVPTRTTGRFTLRVDGVLLERFDASIGSRVIHGLGVYDRGVNPRMRFNTGLSWSLRDLELGTSLRYIGGFRECEDDDCSLPEAKSRRVSAYAVGDVFGSYSFSNALGLTSVSLGINNVLNQDPARIYNGGITSDPSAYDYMGRYFYLGLRHQL